MKKILLTLSLATAMGLSAEAKVVEMGMSAGTSSTNYKLSESSGAIDNNLGFQLGANVTFNLMLLRITPEVLYTYGSFDVMDSSVLGRQCKVKSNQVEVPVIFGLPVLKVITLELGPRFSVFDSAKAKFYSGEPETMDLGRIHEKVGYTAGVKVAISNVTIGARYNGQFGSYDSDYLGKIRNSSYTISVGCKM